MSDLRTDAMQQFDAPRGGHRGAASAGLVLLYAEDFARLPAGWRLQPSGATRIGCAEGAHLHLPVAAVSRAHAELWKDAEGYNVRDLGSTNGTFVDGYRVDRARLEHGQEVRCGDALLKFVSSDIEGYCAHRLEGSPSARGRAAEAVWVGGYQLQQVAEQVKRLSPSPLSVLVTGESGTGKELAARALHDESGRRGPFRGVNCAALPENLLESELFGYKKGAFSGATQDKPGLLRAAHRGTLLLDEVGDMPASAQAKILRVLQAKEVIPLGSTQPEPVDVRIVGATHRDLLAMQRAGEFRGDLYARLNEARLVLPPLRERKEDIYQLVQEFLRRHAPRPLQVSFQFMTALIHYDWPFNVRELESCIKRCVFLATGNVLDESVLTEEIRESLSDYGGPPPDRRAPAKGVVDRVDLEARLARHGGNVAAVGRELGKARMQIHRWIKRYDIDLQQFRK